MVPWSTGKAGGPGFPDISVTSHGLNTALQSHSLGILQGNLKDPVDVEPGPPIGEAGSRQLWSLGCSAGWDWWWSPLPRVLAGSCPFLPGQQVQLKTWLSRQLGTVHVVWVLRHPLKVGGAHGGMEAAEPCGQRARRPAVYPSVSLLYRRWLPWGKALRQQQVKNCRHSGFVQPVCWDRSSGSLPR